MSPRTAQMPVAQAPPKRAPAARTAVPRQLFFVCPSVDRSSENARLVFRHVEVLNRHGLPAFVVHLRERHRVRGSSRWAPEIEIDEYEQRLDAERDVTVLPEAYPEQQLLPLHVFPGRKVIFSQSAFAGFGALGRPLGRSHLYTEPKLKAVITVSEQHATLLRLAFPWLSVHAVRPGVDTEAFRYREPLAKKRQIACSSQDEDTLLALLWSLRGRARAGKNLLSRYRFIFLDGKRPRQLARALEGSLILLALGAPEGLSVLPLQGMLSGCLVGALRGGPFTELLPAPFVFDRQDVPRMVIELEAWVERFERRDPALRRISERGRRRALPYSLEAEERSVLSTWTQVLSDL